jgi:hypothetical protein
MAQVSNVTFAIGTTNVGPEQNFPVFPPRPPDTREYRLVTVGATLNFTPQEIGLVFKLYAALYATDNTSDDTDSFENPTPFLFGEDAGVTKLDNMIKKGRHLVFIPKEYQDITVNAVSMPISFSRHILLNILNEDTDVTFGDPLNGFQTIYLQDELFARVWLTTVGQSATTHVAVR